MRILGQGFVVWTGEGRFIFFSVVAGKRLQLENLSISLQNY